MKKFLPILLLTGFSSPVMADITHKLSSSVQLQVNAAATQVERIGSSWSVSGNGVDTTDGTNVLILCLEGEISYVIEGQKPVILKSGDTIFIKEGLLHLGISSIVPRICLSCTVKKFIPSNEVTYFIG